MKPERGVLELYICIKFLCCKLMGTPNKTYGHRHLQGSFLPFFFKSFIFTVNKGTIPRFITGKKKNSFNEHYVSFSQYKVHRTHMPFSKKQFHHFVYIQVLPQISRFFSKNKAWHCAYIHREKITVFTCNVYKCRTIFCEVEFFCNICC